MILYFFDTSALVKLYHKEKGSTKTTSLFEAKGTENDISQIAFTEFNCSLYKKFRTKEISEEKDVLQIIRHFEIDMQHENVLIVDDSTFSEARNLIIKWGGVFGLRTLDAIQLASFTQLAQLNEITFISADNRLCNLVAELGYDVINVSSDDL